MKQLFVLAIAVMLSAALVSTAQASPYFTTPTKNKIVGIIKSDSDCWHEYYARATPKNNNHVLLNKETIKNNDAPDVGPSETHQFAWYYDYNKMTQTAATNEGKIRTYVTIELTDDITGETVTHYTRVTPDIARLDVGIFYMHTNTALCR